MMSRHQCRCGCDMKMDDLLAFSYVVTRRKVVRLEKCLRRHGRWNNGFPTTDVEDESMCDTMFEMTKYDYFESYVIKMCREQVPHPWCEECGRLADLFCVSADDGKFRCRVCRRRHDRRVGRRRDDEDDTSTRCPSDADQDGVA